jgi:hypothetical protein
MNALKLLVPVCLLGISTIVTLQATPLDLVPAEDVPYFNASLVSISYDSTLDMFEVHGTTDAYMGGVSELLGPGDYTLTATISDAGLLTCGQMLITGDLGSGTVPLLTANLITGPSGTAFGFPEPLSGGGALGEHNVFEFLFTVTGGNPTIMSEFGPQGGVVLDAWFSEGDLAFDGSWEVDFDNSASLNGLAGSFAIVPEPSAVSLAILGGLLGVAVYGRRRNSRPVSV